MQIFITFYLLCSPALELAINKLTSAGRTVNRWLRQVTRETRAWISQTVDWSCDDCLQAFADVTDTFRQLTNISVDMYTEAVAQVKTSSSNMSSFNIHVVMRNSCIHDCTSHVHVHVRAQNTITKLAIGKII